MAENADEEAREIGQLADEASEFQRRRYEVRDDAQNRGRADGAAGERRDERSDDDSGAGSNLTDF